MDDNLALYRECCFPDCKTLWWIKLLSQVLGGTISPWIRPWPMNRQIQHIRNFYLYNLESFLVNQRRHVFHRHTSPQQTNTLVAQRIMKDKIPKPRHPAFLLAIYTPPQNAIFFGIGNQSGACRVLIVIMLDCCLSLRWLRVQRWYMPHTSSIVHFSG